MRRFFKRVVGDEGGALLMEAVAAVGILTLLGSAVMTSVAATTKASSQMQTTADADSIASNQMTAILAGPYEDPPYSYTPISPLPTGYSVAADSVEYIPGDTYISKIVVKVYKNGNFILKLESMRLKGQ